MSSFDPTFEWNPPPSALPYGQAGGMELDQPYPPDPAAISSLAPQFGRTHSQRDLVSMPPSQSRRNVRQRFAARTDPDAMAEAQFALPAGFATSFAPNYGLTPATLAAALRHTSASTGQQMPLNPWVVPAISAGPSTNIRNGRLSIDTSFPFSPPDMTAYTLPSLRNQANSRRVSTAQPYPQHQRLRRHPGYTPQHGYATDALSGSSPDVAPSRFGRYDEQLMGHADHFVEWGMAPMQDQSTYGRAQDGNFDFRF
jgi:hypothetical protein